MPQFAPVHSVTVGDFKVTYLKDGGGIITPTAMYPASSEEGWQAHNNFLNDEDRIIVSIGGFLIETGDHKIIMDLGFGPQTVEFPGFGPFIGGEFMKSLAQTGVSPEEITAVVYSHLHLDHVGWTTTDGAFTFPNAAHYCHQADWEFWLTDESGMGPHPEAIQKPLASIIQFIKGGDEIVPGFTVIDTPGHTPGHLSFRIDGGDQLLYLIADLLHSEVQFYEADWFVAFDIDPAAARQTREGIYDTIAQPNVIVADGHFANNVFGRLVNEAGKWQWQPLGLVNK